jgi:hypothetical protein
MKEKFTHIFQTNRHDQCCPELKECNQCQEEVAPVCNYHFSCGMGCCCSAATTYYDFTPSTSTHLLDASTLSTSYDSETISTISSTASNDIVDDQSFASE